MVFLISTLWDRSMIRPQLRHRNAESHPLGGACRTGHRRQKPPAQNPGGEKGPRPKTKPPVHATPDLTIWGGLVAIGHTTGDTEQSTILSFLTGTAANKPMSRVARARLRHDSMRTVAIQTGSCRCPYVARPNPKPPLSKSRALSGIA